MVNPLAFSLLVSTLLTAASAQYKLTQDYTGQNFFQNFDFYNGPDPTNGHVKFVGEATANLTGLAGLLYYGNASEPSTAVYLGVDSTTVLAPGKGRKSTRVESVQTFNRSLVIADILHQPSNVCGVWPAFWMLGMSAPWPAAGEIDILENVNNATHNKMTIHSNAGLVVNGMNGTMTGNMTTTNCDVAAPNQDKNAGCMVDDNPSTNSYGEAFNQRQGGVFAVEYTREAVRIWFFNRTRIPDDIAAGTPKPPTNNSDLHNWGKPNALFQVPAASNGSTLTILEQHLQDMKIIFDTTFCGDWAGKVWNSTGCGGLAPTCEEYVEKNPSAFEDVYWLIKSIQVFTDLKQIAKRTEMKMTIEKIERSVAEDGDEDEDGYIGPDVDFNFEPENEDMSKPGDSGTNVRDSRISHLRRALNNALTYIRGHPKLSPGISSSTATSQSTTSLLASTSPSHQIYSINTNTSSQTPPTSTQTPLQTPSQNSTPTPTLHSRDVRNPFLCLKDPSRTKSLDDSVAVNLALDLCRFVGVATKTSAGVKSVSDGVAEENGVVFATGKPTALATGKATAGAGFSFIY